MKVNKIKTFKQLTPEDIEYIRRERAKGTKNKIIAAHFYVSEFTLSTWCRKLKIPSRSNCSKRSERSRELQALVPEIQRMREAGLSDEKISQILKISTCTIRVYAGNRNGQCRKRKSKRKGVPYDVRPFSLNPNAPTADTIMLIGDYYREDMARGFSHDEAVSDIRLELGRERDFIYDVLKEKEII